jgi:hypothetical protein
LRLLPVGESLALLAPARLRRWYHTLVATENFKSEWSHSEYLKSAKAIQIVHDEFELGIRRFTLHTLAFA